MLCIRLAVSRDCDGDALSERLAVAVPLALFTTLSDVDGREDDELEASTLPVPETSDDADDKGHTVALLVMESTGVVVALRDCV